MNNQHHHSPISSQEQVMHSTLYHWAKRRGCVCIKQGLCWRSRHFQSTYTTNIWRLRICRNSNERIRRLLQSTHPSIYTVTRSSPLILFSSSNATLIYLTWITLISMNKPHWTYTWQECSVCQDTHAHGSQGLWHIKTRLMCRLCASGFGECQGMISSSRNSGYICRAWLVPAMQKGRKRHTEKRMKAGHPCHRWVNEFFSELERASYRRKYFPIE